MSPRGPLSSLHPPPWCLQHCLLTLQLLSRRLFGVLTSLPSLKCWCPSGLSPWMSRLFWLPAGPRTVLINSHSLQQSLYAGRSQTTVSSVTHAIFQFGQVTSLLLPQFSSSVKWDTNSTDLKVCCEGKKWVHSSKHLKQCLVLDKPSVNISYHFKYYYCYYRLSLLRCLLGTLNLVHRKMENITI